MGSDLKCDLPVGCAEENGRLLSCGELKDLFVDEISRLLDNWVDEDRVPSTKGKLEYFAEEVLSFLDGKGMSMLFPKFVLKWNDKMEGTLTGDLADRFRTLRKL